MINLDEIQDMWRRDSKLDPDNLHLESLKIPGLHSKYYDLYNQLKLLRVKAEAEFAGERLVNDKDRSTSVGDPSSCKTGVVGL